MAVTYYGTLPNNEDDWNTLTLSSAAISDANSDGSLTVMLVHEDDFKSNETLLTTPATTGGLFINMDGGQVYMSEAAESLRPKLSATYSDSSTSTIYANTSGSFDDGAFNSNNANALTARNAESAQSFIDAGAFGVLGHAHSPFFSLRYIYRLAFRFEIDASKTLSSGSLSWRFLPDTGNAFVQYVNTKTTYVCKMADYGSEFDDSGLGTKVDYNALDGWASSGTYEATETAVTYDSLFFGTNF